MAAEEMAMKRLSRATCHDCGVKEGQFHLPGCDMERCPFCGGQLGSYGGGYEKVQGVPGGVLPPGESYVLGGALCGKGPVAFTAFPDLSAKCGDDWPCM